MPELRAVTYTPASPLRAPLGMVRDQWQDILAARDLAWRLFIRNLSARYRQTALGYFWAVFPMLATTAIWLVLAERKILNIGDTGAPLPLFLLTGMMLWQTFVDALQTPMRVVSESKDMLAKINFPREALPMTALAEVTFNTAIRSLILFIGFVYFAHLPAATAVAAPLGVVVLVTFGLLLGLVLVPFGILYQDVAQALLLVTQVWMLLTPVLYPPATTGIASWVNTFNPVSPLIVATRDWMLIGPSAALGPFCVVACLTFLAIGFGLILYRVAMPILIERMPS